MADPISSSIDEECFRDGPAGTSLASLSLALEDWRFGG